MAISHEQAHGTHTANGRDPARRGLCCAAVRHGGSSLRYDLTDTLSYRATEVKNESRTFFDTSDCLTAQACETGRKGRGKRNKNRTTERGKLKCVAPCGAFRFWGRLTGGGDRRLADPRLLAHTPAGVAGMGAWPDAVLHSQKRKPASAIHLSTRSDVNRESRVAQTNTASGQAGTCLRNPGRRSMAGERPVRARHQCGRHVHWDRRRGCRADRPSNHLGTGSATGTLRLGIHEANVCEASVGDNHHRPVVVHQCAESCPRDNLLPFVQNPAAFKCVQRLRLRSEREHQRHVSRMRSSDCEE